jgi:hypothetical protein
MHSESHVYLFCVSSSQVGMTSDQPVPRDGLLSRCSPAVVRAGERLGGRGYLARAKYWVGPRSRDSALTQSSSRKLPPGPISTQP